MRRSLRVSTGGWGIDLYQLKPLCRLIEGRETVEADQGEDSHGA